MAKIFKTAAVLAVLGFGLVILTGCPTEVERGPTITVTALGDTDLIGGQSLTFEASVGGWMPQSVDNSVVWSIVEQGTHGGTFLDGSVLTVSTLERHQRLTVRAALEVDPSIFGQVEVSVTPPTPVITRWELNAPVNAPRGMTVIIPVIMEGIHNPPTAASWTILTTGHHADTVISGGLLTISAAEPMSEITIRATSDHDPQTSGEATIGFSTLPARMGTVVPGGSHTVAIGSDGSLWAWGNNEFGQIGDGRSGEASNSRPVRIGTYSDWVDVSAGDRHVLAIRADGSLWAWGNNENGRTGLGTDAGNTSAPARVGTATGWEAVSAGVGHSLAIRNGELWAWGNNANGRTGLGSDTGNTNAPARVGTDTDWVYVSAGVEHSMGIREDADGYRTLWVWGNGANGRLGSGNANSQSSPVQAGAATDWAAVSAGNNHSMGVRTNGTLWATGSTNDGQLGGGWGGGQATANFLQVGSLTVWASVAAGNRHTIATRTDGTLWATGSTDNGQLGGGWGVGQVSASFMQVGGAGGATNWEVVRGSPTRTHNAVPRTDGTLWAWGTNVDGRLGDGTTGERPTAVQIIPLP